MKLDKLFKRKEEKVKQLIADFESGKVLQVDNNIDNKEYFKNLENDKHTKPEEKNNELSINE